MAIAALVGVSIFGTLVYQAVDVEEVGQSEAFLRFDEIQKQFANQVPMIEVDAAGLVIPGPVSPAAIPAVPLKRLEVLAYRSAGERLVVAHVPFWFFRMKRPALQFALRDTGLDLDRLQLTTETLTRHGPGLVLDQRLQNGDRLLVWVE